MKKQDRKTKKKESLKKRCNWIFACWFLMKQKQIRRKGKTETNIRNQKKAKQIRQEGRKKKKQDRDREREIEEVGGQKRIRRNKGRHSKTNKNCPFLGGKQVFFHSEAKKETKKGNKEGLGPT